MSKYSKRTNKLVFTVLVIIFVMVTAVVVLANQNGWLKPGSGHGHGDGDARWKVEFTSIAEGEKTGEASSRYAPYHTSTFATFYVDLVVPGDSITYDIQVSNRGTLDATLDEIYLITNRYKDAIKYEILGIDEGDILKKGTSKNFKVKVSYELTATEAVEFDKPISMSFVFKQKV